MRRESRALLCSWLLLSLPSVAPGVAQEAAPAAEASARYRDARLTVEERVADLLPRLTLEEKVGQIAGFGEAQSPVLDTTGTFTAEEARTALRRMWDAEFALPARRVAILRNAVQRHLRERTRLGIPALFMGEALHGFMQNGATSFPQALALASTWDPELVRRVFAAAGDEAGSSGTGQVFTPVLDIARDPRWGRTEETYGEDPFLASRMGVAAIRGLQGDSFRIDRHHVMATAKHFAVHGQPEGGTNTAPGNYSERVIREEFLLPFQAAVVEAGVGSVMASYNEIDGVPSHVSDWLLDKVLRQEWGFRGFVTSDGNGLQMLVDTHHVAANNAEAARRSLAAGVDFDLSDGSVFRTLLLQVKDGIVPERELDRAVGRVLAAKFRLGLFDDPFVDPDYAERITSGPEHRKLALEAAQKAVVLLKNDTGLLPLDLARLKTIAVIGPNAADVHIGGYGREPGHGVSLLQGIRDRVGTKAQVLYAEGCRITNARQGWRGWLDDDVKLVEAKTQAASIRAAVAAAREASVAIVVVGENESTNREAWSERHLGDRDSLDLLGAQDELVRAVVATGTPTVVFLINGRPLSINWIAEHVSAIVEGFYLGQEGGTAAASVLFGDVNPGGKLPIGFPRSVGDLPAYYYRRPSANRSYAFGDRTPLFPFGHGLSYTSFRFERLRVVPERIAVGGSARVSVDVTNTGAREGDEVVQLYVHQRLSSLTRPIQLLKAFERVTLKPGETRTVTLAVTPDALSMLDRDMRRVVEPGIFELRVGSSSSKTSTATLAVTGVNGETGLPALPPPPPGSQAALVSGFEEAQPTAAYGSWIVATDALMGGTSTAAMRVVKGGANGSSGSLEVSGSLAVGGPFPFAGVVFAPASSLTEAANLSGKKEIAFWARGDGHSYSVLVATASRAGQLPVMKTIVAGPDWKPYSFPLSVFDTDGHDVTGVGIVRSEGAGRFELQLDELEIR
jgi:beta-glucosidase